MLGQPGKRQPADGLHDHALELARGLEAAGNIRVVARIKPGNIRSLRAFRALGFDGCADDQDELVQLVHEPAGIIPRADA